MSEVLASPSRPNGPDADAPEQEHGPSTKATFAIRSSIRASEASLRARYPALTRHQDAIAFALWLGSLSAMVSSAILYLGGVFPAFATIVVSAFFCSVLHELEHDLIHRLYFNGSIVSDVMLAAIWLAKTSLNPWTRRGYHLLHHRRSGQVDDVEERLIGLGVRNVFLRVAVALFPPTAALWIKDIERDHGTWKSVRGHFFSGERLMQGIDGLFFIAPFACAVCLACGVPGAREVLVCWLAPNVLRHASLVLMSSYSHYYGDIASNDITQQNQILSTWLLAPFNLFCFNFSAEHIIHHFVVGQPFFIRHMIRREAWRAMRLHGVRENDFGIVARGNRWGGDEGTTAAKR